MPIIPLILLVLAFVLFCVGGWLAPEPRPFTRFACAGLAAWVLAEILTRAGLTH